MPRTRPSRSRKRRRQPKSRWPRGLQAESPQPKKLSALSPKQKSRLQSARTGQRLLRFDRRLGARFVAGADEAGRGSLAGPLVVAGVLLDYDSLRDHRVRPLAQLNDSKQVGAEEREELFRAVLAGAAQISVQVISPGEIDREGLHRSNLAGLRRALRALTPPAEACLVDGFRLGPAAPEHIAVVDGDERSAAIAAASIVAKVVRDRAMRRLTRCSRRTASPRTSATSRRGTRGSCASAGRARSIAAPFRRSATSVRKRPRRDSQRSSTRALGSRAERRARWHYRLRGYRILAATVWVGGYELDLVARRGRTLVFCEVKSKTNGRFGDPLEMVGPEKLSRLRRAATAWLAAHAEHRTCETRFDVVALRAGRLERLSDLS